MSANRRASTTWQKVRASVSIPREARVSVGESRNFWEVAGWTKNEVEEMQTIWKEMIEKSVDGKSFLGVATLIWILESLPDVKALFTFAVTQGDESSQMNVADQRFLKHAMNLVYELDKLIEALDNPHFSYDLVEAFAQLHISKGISSRHFEHFRDRFHLLLYDLDHTGKNSRKARLWYQYFDVLVRVYKMEEDKKGVRHDLTRCESLKTQCPCSIL